MIDAKFRGRFWFRDLDRYTLAQVNMRIMTSNTNNASQAIANPSTNTREGTVDCNLVALTDGA